MATGGLGAQKASADPFMRTCSLAGFELNSGVKLPEQAKMAYRVFGDGPKLGICGTSYSAVHTDLEFVVGTIIPKDYTFVVFNMIGNGVSYSPSNDPEGYPLTPPKITNVNDQVRAQKLALDNDKDFAGKKIDLVYGFSMGAMQALEWPKAYPDLVSHSVPVCGSSGCTSYNAVFLDALIAILESTTASRDDKLRAFAACYAGWYVGPAFYAQKTWETKGFKSLEDFEENFGRAFFKDMDPYDLLAQLRTWRSTPVFTPEECKSIKAKVLMLPCDGDTYFRPEDIYGLEQKFIPNCTTKVIPSPWGHLAGTPDGLDMEFNFIKDAVAEFLK